MNCRESFHPERFATVAADDLPFLRPRLHASRTRSCEFALGNLFLWGPAFHIRWQEAAGHLYLEMMDEEEKTEAIMFVPEADRPDPSPECLAEASRLVREHGNSGVFQHVSREYLDAHPDTAEHFRVEEMPPAFAEYIHAIPDLADLQGEKYSKKRNLVKQFFALHPDASTRPLADADLAACLDLARRWRLDHDNPDSIYLLQEESALQRLACVPLDDLAMVGYGAFVGDTLAAFEFCSPIAGNLWDEHFEKADFAFKGAAQAVNRDCARFLRDRRGAAWLNREQDMGSPGLRQAKLSYHPATLLQEHLLIPRG